MPVTLASTMKTLALPTLVLLAPLVAQADPPDALCAPLQAFVDSVPPAESRAFTFHTIWGRNFKDAAEPALSGKRCAYHGHDAAKAVCVHLMQHGATEFAGRNVARVLECLAPGTAFARNLDLRQGTFSLTVGAPERDRRVRITFGEDAPLGGMALQVMVSGD
jgi:hypothetical protein